MVGIAYKKNRATNTFSVEASVVKSGSGKREGCCLEEEEAWVGRTPPSAWPGCDGIRAQGQQRRDRIKWENPTENHCLASAPREVVT